VGEEWEEGSKRGWGRGAERTHTPEPRSCQIQRPQGEGERKGPKGTGRREGREKGERREVEWGVMGGRR
jgi:hypothetical protein